MARHGRGRPLPGPASKMSFDGDVLTLRALADKAERQRRTSLRQALTRAARNLEPYDPDAAALARHWSEVAA